MLPISLGLTVVLLLILNRVARTSAAFRLTGVSGAFLLVLSFFAAMISPLLGLPPLLLAIVTIAWRFSQRRPTVLLKWSLGATFLAYGCWGFLTLSHAAENARLRGLYPFQSMEARVPEPRPGGSSMNAESAARLSRIEASELSRWGGLRSFQLKRVHERATWYFINSPGFGMSRTPEPTLRGLSRTYLAAEDLPQPGNSPALTWSPGALDPLPAADRESVAGLIEASIWDFAHPSRDGLAKDRRYVAGFVPHQFSKVPGPAGGWEVQTLELLSLLIHDEPVIYVFSDQLPRMDKIHSMPTRSPNRFESNGLESLRQGEDIVTARDREGIRMLGAIRSAKQCVQCHGGERGDLLGAFSYTLTPTAAGPEMPQVPE